MLKKIHIVLVFAALLPMVGCSSVARKKSQQAKDAYPAWIKDFIAREETYPVADPPASLMQCGYKNQTVYYVPPRCCDVPGILYDETGNAICSPDGGISGIGNGKCPDFLTTRKNCRTVWKDTRAAR